MIEPCSLTEEKKHTTGDLIAGTARSSKYDIHAPQQECSVPSVNRVLVCASESGASSVLNHRCRRFRLLPRRGLLRAFERLGRVKPGRDHKLLELGQVDRGGVVVVGLVGVGKALL